MFDLQVPVQIEEIKDPILAASEVRLYIQREDLAFPLIAGNKWRKLKYNLIQAREENQDTLLTFGGAYSNHIAATAAAGKMYGFKTIGMVRGEECSPLNATITKAKAEGMVIHYVDRSVYKYKKDCKYLESLKNLYGDFYLLPEGGSNSLAVKGCAEMLNCTEEAFDVICCPVGTGATLAGLIVGCPAGKSVMGFSSLKGAAFLNEDIKSFLSDYTCRSIQNWHIEQGYHFGGYGKITQELLLFSMGFFERTAVPLDMVYTAKMIYGIYDKIKKGEFFKGQKILAIHTGGLQGNTGFGL